MQRTEVNHDYVRGTEDGFRAGYKAGAQLGAVTELRRVIAVMSRLTDEIPPNSDLSSGMLVMAGRILKALTEDLK